MITVIRYVYVVEPVDHWEGWQRPDAECFAHWHEYYPGWWEEKLAQLARIVPLPPASEISEGPEIAVLPCRGPGSGAIVIGWKEHDNGTTFIASPYRLHWLEESRWNEIGMAMQDGSTGWLSPLDLDAIGEGDPMYSPTK